MRRAVCRHCAGDLFYSPNAPGYAGGLWFHSATLALVCRDPSGKARRARPEVERTSTSVLQLREAGS